ncbi:GNAT family N-acetyltransferase [Actinoplanes italicus]|uniref:GNAT family N-acetyltransferase n=1 Tax=Actinoplanes italicus TaxID=113567 RepID=UPI0011B28C50|nr:GNAT family N-acetyltransferase [Actinoplanes italicus]
MEITKWYLEQDDATLIRPARPPAEPVEIIRAELPSPELNRFLYTAVGGDWSWTDRLPWTWQQWQDWLDRPGIETWVAYVRGTPAGYAELDGTVPGVVDIAYFGLLPRFAGQGIGGHLLTVTLRNAWSLAERHAGFAPVERVTVNTCSLDGPAALTNYQARGLTVRRTEILTPSAEPTAPGPWPGARPAADPPAALPGADPPAAAPTQIL